jgi:hypothetical protein
VVLVAVDVQARGALGRERPRPSLVEGERHIRGGWSWPLNILDYVYSRNLHTLERGTFSELLKYTSTPNDVAEAEMDAFRLELSHCVHAQVRIGEESTLRSSICT